MSVQNEENTNARFALEFLIKANIESNHGIEDAPQEFIDKRISLIRQLNKAARGRILQGEVVDNSTSDSNSGPEYLINRKWQHKSVVNLVAESGNDDPINEIKMRARRTVLFALQNGWDGPPFSTIELAKILKFEISPNEQISDARTIGLNNGKFLIEYNPVQPPTRMNFSIAHEITHTLFSDCRAEIRNREEDPDKNRELEQLCNIGASELQLPFVIFPDDANAIADISIESLKDLAKKYKCSLESLFIAFVQTIDRPCAIMICSFFAEDRLVIDYYKASSKFQPKIPNKFHIPQSSRAYYCTAPGWTESETVEWDFLDANYDIFCVGLSPMRKEKRARVGIVIVPNSGREKLQDRRINIVFGDATKPRGNGKKIIAQVVNTGGGLGAGFGKALVKNYPGIKDAVIKWKSDKNKFQLGYSQTVQVKHDTYVFQMLAQKGIYAKDDKIPLDYMALQKCLASLREAALEMGADVFMPLIGAGQAKGKWEVIEALIYSELVNEGVKVNIYLLKDIKAGNDFKPRATLSIFNEKSTWQKEE